MAVKIFKSSPYKEAIKQALREGKSVEELGAKFPVATRTIYRYLKEVHAESRLEVSRPIRITVDLSFADFRKVLSLLGQKEEVGNDK